MKQVILLIAAAAIGLIIGTTINNKLQSRAKDFQAYSGTSMIDELEGEWRKEKK